jgi:hypothetical protein
MVATRISARTLLLVAHHVDPCAFFWGYSGGCVAVCRSALPAGRQVAAPTWHRRDGAAARPARTRRRHDLWSFGYCGQAAGSSARLPRSLIPCGFSSAFICAIRGSHSPFPVPRGRWTLDVRCSTFLQSVLALRSPLSGLRFHPSSFPHSPFPVPFRFSCDR